MVNKKVKSSSNNQKQLRETTRDATRRILKTRIKESVNEIHAKQGKSVKEKVQKHRKNLQALLSEVKSVISERESLGTEENINILSSRIQSPFYKHNSSPISIADEDQTCNEDFPIANSIKIPYLEKLPSYISWVHVARNEKMAEDQSVIGKEQMYCDINRGEMVICSDSDEETVNVEDVKHEFTEAEDQILWKTLHEYGSNGNVLAIIKEFVKTTDSQIQERFEKLKEINLESLNKHSKDCHCRGCESHIGICLEKGLTANIESLDNLFCRQCLIFNCSLHGTSQPLVYPTEKQLVWSEDEGDRQPCSDQCGLLLKDVRLSSENSAEKRVNNLKLDWKPLERELYLKGVELFGNNSCRIAHNLLPGLKTCSEVARYILAEEESLLQGLMPLSITNNNDQINAESMDQETPSRSQLPRRRGKYPRKKADGKKQSNTQYTPCRCHGICTNECTCHRDGNRCEKYCGCSKLCPNRFRGCYCAKSQCRSKLCPCFAINRECDPDICRNCGISCSDGSPGELPGGGDGQCGNMNLLLGKKERILLAKSNVVGWGVFAKNPIDKDACLGEYTGELITHKEAEKRGKLYNRINHSFLFDLNDKWVIDARRYGDKLKFANHSSKPNCYAKVMLVGGDHRVGIYAKENIKAGDEIFYDYFYKKECAPLWARRPDDDEASKEHGSLVSKRRTKVDQRKPSTQGRKN